MAEWIAIPGEWVDRNRPHLELERCVGIVFNPVPNTR